MNKELEQRLYDKFIFMRGKNNCIPCYCDDGWFNLIQEFCTEVESFSVTHNISLENICISEIKEKYGTLRIDYICTNQDFSVCLDSLIIKYENMSETICEARGSIKGQLQDINGWLSTLCSECLEKL